MIVIGGGTGAIGLLVMLVLLGLFLLLPVLLFVGFTRRAVRAADTWQGQPDPGEQWQGEQWLSGGSAAGPAPAADLDPADVTSLQDRLGSDVRTLDPGADPVARQAMADASERLSMSTTLLERADSPGKLRTAWLAAVEGLAAARVARERLGLDPGPAVPTLPSAGPRLSTPSRIEVDGEQHVGGPDYEPGRPHYFPGGAWGGRYVPGGWYDAPFWPAALLVGGLSGLALGGLLAGPAYGAAGLDEGLGGDWGDGGGDVFGGGGFGGGGDWGGDLGGDFGGDW